MCARTQEGAQEGERAGKARTHRRKVVAERRQRVRKRRFRRRRRRRYKVVLHLRVQRARGACAACSQPGARAAQRQRGGGQAADDGMTQAVAVEDRRPTSLFARIGTHLGSKLRRAAMIFSANCSSESSSTCNAHYTHTRARARARTHARTRTRTHTQEVHVRELVHLQGPSHARRRRKP